MAPASKFTRDASFGIKLLNVVVKLVGPLVGMCGSIRRAARRYVEVLELDANETGHFYATRHRKKLVGPMDKQTWPALLTNPDLQEAAFDAVVAMTGIRRREFFCGAEPMTARPTLRTTHSDTGNDTCTITTMYPATGNFTRRSLLATWTS